jgi:hypothetical protein
MPTRSLAEKCANLFRAQGWVVRFDSAIAGGIRNGQTLAEFPKDIGADTFKDITR